MIKLSTTFIAFLLLASLLAGIPSFASATDKARILADISATPSRSSVRAKSNPKESTEIALDLIVYRWALSYAKNMPNDISNANEIISSLASALKNPLINWANEVFSPTRASQAKVALPPSDDSRVEILMELNRQFSMACGWRESSPLQSVNALVVVLKSCQQLQLDLTGALVGSVLGNQYHYEMACYRQAELCYNNALWVYRSYSCRASAAMLFDYYGSLCIEMSRSPGAAENYNFSAQQWALLAKQYPKVARYREMAGKEFILAGQAQTEAGDSDKGLMLMNYGIDHLWAAATMSKSYNTLVTNLIALADAYADRNDYPKALDRLKSASKACQYGNDPLLTARVHEKLYSAYKAMNLTSAANQELDKRDKVLLDASLAGEVALGRLNLSEPMMTKDSQAKLFLAAERGAAAFQASKKYARAESLLRRLIAIYKQFVMTDQQINCMRSLSSIMDLQHNPQESLAVRLEAANIAINANKKGIAAQIVRDMVQAFIEIGDLENALDLLTDLAPIIEQSGNVRGAADVLDGRGTLLASHGRYEDAVRDFKDALTRYSTLVGDPWAAGAVSVKLAAALDALKKPDEACAVLEPVLRRIENRYSEENVDPARNPDRSRLIMNLYRELASCYVHCGKSDDAEALLTNARRYLWIGDLVTQLKASSDSGIAEFAKKVNILNGTSTDSVPDVPRTQKVLARNWADFSAQCRLIREQHAARYNALPIDPLELYKSRNELPQKSLVVEYMTVSTSTFVFVCGNSKASIWELGVSGREINSSVALLRESLQSCEQSLAAGVPLPQINDWREPTAEIRTPLVSLYSELVSPIAEEFASYQVIMFALPDSLDGIPMHALISSETDGVPRFFIQDYEVGYLRDFMLGDLIGRDSRSIDPGSDRLAVFADPAGNLSGASEEASMLGKLGFDAAPIYVGKKATVASFVKECDKAGILHIALHYTIDPDPSKFVVQLAPDGDSSGAITVHELTAITNPHLQLVVLSACDSAASADPLRSGSSCAAEVFSLAGAKSVLGSLWKVSDAASLRLMEDFYKTLMHSKSRADSLQHAQIAMIEGKEYAHPFYWACFALYGNPW